VKLTVMGAGYVGLVTAACLARLGHDVACLEVAPERLEALRAGRVPFHEPGLAELVAEGIEAGRLRPVGDAARALPGADAVLVCVGTPLDGTGVADLSQIRSACRDIAEHAPQAVVLLRSTLPLGAWAEIGRWMGRQDAGQLALNPEFLRQGTAVSDFLAPTRIVIGTPDGQETQASSTVRQIYATLESPILVTDFASAEMIKNAANVFLAAKLTFINEIADLCASYGADIGDVVTGIGLDPRIGGSYLRPGIGFGGSCLPKELANIVRLGEAAGVDLPMLQGAVADNAARPANIVDRLEARLGRLRGRRVGMLGLSFKPHTDDLRDSPAIAMAKAMLERGAQVIAHDPVVRLEATKRVEGLQRSASVEGICRDADLVLLATEWPEYEELDWPRLATLTRRAVLFDGRRALHPATIRAAGWSMLGIGRADEPIAEPERRERRATLTTTSRHRERVPVPLAGAGAVSS